MARRAPKQWVYSPRKPTSPKIPAALKAQVSEKADELVDSYPQTYLHSARSARPPV
ncbi:MAG: hypothetical protein R2932_11890 [Caldilineaceae bacterium]